LLHDDQRVRGLEIRNTNTGELRQLRAPIVINAAGHWAPALAGRFGTQIEETPRNSWAWNILFDVANESGYAAAVSARRANSQTFFMLPWKGKTLVGTGHAPVPPGADANSVPENLIREYIEQISEAVPALNLTESAVVRVDHGIMPATAGGELQLASRPLVVDHGNAGVKGLYTVWGIKYTTARDVARSVIRKAFPSLRNVSVTYQRPKTK